jgi:di- and tripeptidase
MYGALPTVLSMCCAVTDKTQVWSTRTFERLYSIHSHHDVGDLFAVAYSPRLKTVYCGAQNTSIQVSDLSLELSRDARMT